MIDQAVGFVMSHIDARVAPRHISASTEVKYEIPIEAVTEAIVNAVTHRDYASNGSVQVMLFRDRLEVWNPGSLPFGLSPAKLKQLHSSLPPNPVLANPIYLAGYIERMGTGTRRETAIGKSSRRKTDDCGFFSTFALFNNSK